VERARFFAFFFSKKEVWWLYEEINKLSL